MKVQMLSLITNSMFNTSKKGGKEKGKKKGKKLFNKFQAWFVHELI